MTPIPAKVTAVEKPGDHYQVIVQISTASNFQTPAAKRSESGIY
jgi:hypothetical protein